MPAVAETAPQHAIEKSIPCKRAENCSGLCGSSSGRAEKTCAAFARTGSRASAGRPLPEVRPIYHRTRDFIEAYLAIVC